MTNAPDPQAFLVEAFQGEVLGESFFALMAEREEEAARVPQWRLLERLERHVKERLQAELERQGLPADEAPQRRATGRELARGLSALGFDKARPVIADNIRAGAEEMRASTSRLPGELQEIARFFVGHEQALLEYFESAEGWSEANDPVRRFLAETDARDESPVPEGVQLLPFDPIYQAEPAVVYRELQRRAPVHRDRQLGGLVVSSHDLVERIAYDLDFWVDPRKAREDDPVRQFLVTDGEREPSMLFLDDPEHKRLRNLVSRSFTPRAVRLLRPLIDHLARELVDSIEASGEPEFDLIEQLAAPLPAIAIARILGIDADEQAQFKAWSVASSEAFFNPLADDEMKRKGEEATKALDACFRSEIAKRHAEPADDLIGKLVAAELAGDRLSEAELVAMCGLLLVAGNVTTTDLIGNGMRALLERPDEHAKLRARPELIVNCVEEMLRFDPPVHATGRIAPRDCEIEGVPLRKGESVNVLLAAANRDPDVYPEPDRFDIEREDTHHHAFGGGAHLCIGAHLARAEAQAAIGEIVARFPKLRPAGKPLEWKATPGFRGLAEYRVRIS